MRREKYPTYEERFIRFSYFVEKWLIWFILLFTLTLILSQLLLHIDMFREWMVEVERLEGIAS